MFLEGIFDRIIPFFGIVSTVKRFLLEYLPAWLLLMVLAFIVVHAPLTVWLGTQWPGAAVAVKAWKELLISLALLLVAVGLWRRGQLRAFVAQPVVAVALVYVALHEVMCGVYPQPIAATVAGLLIDVRYVLYFVAVLGFLRLYPSYRAAFMRVAVVGAAVVVGFAVLELVLPRDILTVLGYGPNTIEPYLTVDKNPDFIRYNSTLRGPNPLGAYAAMVLAGATAYLATKRQQLRGWRQWAMPISLLLAAIVAVWVSYSRSALIGAGIAVAVVLVVRFGRAVPRRTWAVIVGCIAVGLVTLVLARDSYVVQNVLLHNNPATGAAVDSNAAHADSLNEGLARLAVQPLGAGVGSTGSASLLGSNGIIIENSYLMIAHEVGWLGLGVFIVLFVLLMRQLWRGRRDWLALAMFASGCGLAFIGLMLPVWADDTVSIVWWGLAAVAISRRK